MTQIADNLQKHVYDDRDVARLNREDAYALRFIFHQQFDIKKAAAQVDASLRFRKDFGLNGKISNIFFVIPRLAINHL